MGLKLAIGRDGRKPKELDQIIKSIIPGHEVQNTGVRSLEPGVSKRNLGPARAQSWAGKCQLQTADRNRNDCNTPGILFNQIMALLEASKECVKLWRERAEPLYIEVTGSIYSSYCILALSQTLVQPSFGPNQQYVSPIHRTYRI